MSVPVWPAELPPPNRSGFSLESGDGRLRSRTDAGPPRFRRRYSATAAPVQLTVDLTRPQLGRFDAFLAEDLAGGSLPFLMPDPLSHGWALLTGGEELLRIEDGTGLLIDAWWLVLIGDRMPARGIVGSRIRVSLALVVLP